MAEYIEREAAIAVIYGQHVGGKEACENARPNTYGADLREIVADIEDIPAADVRPVVRGKWIADYDYTEYDYDGSTPLPEPRKFQDGWKCSLCGAYEPSTVNYCPSCGADMMEDS